MKSFTTGSIKVSSVSLDKTYYAFDTIGASITLKATVYPTEATNKAYEWSSDNTSVATVDSSGKVTAKGNGSCYITVTTLDQGKTAQCRIEVSQLVTSLSVDETSITLVEGKTKTLTASVAPSNAANKTVHWRSTNTAIATVSQSGVVTAVSKGTATIMVTANDRGTVSASCAVTVAPKPTAVDMGTVVNGKNVKWANFNIGASDRLGYGYYFSWGETETKDNYIWAYYKFGTSTSITKYNDNSAWGTVDNKTVLDAQDDVARVRLGGNWRMPTEAEWNALKSKCTWSWKVLNGVYGQLVTATNGNTIFLPAAGYMLGTTLDLAGSYGYYWTTSLSSSSSRYGLAFYFLTSNWHTTDGIRPYGYTVRAVTE